MQKIESIEKIAAIKIKTKQRVQKLQNEQENSLSAIPKTSACSIEQSMDQLLFQFIKIFD